jgi:hypothetical protein
MVLLSIMAAQPLLLVSKEIFVTFYPAVNFHNLSSPVPPAEALYLGHILASMCTAMSSGLFTSTTSISGIPPESAEEIGRSLRALGYGVDFNTTPGSVIVSW